LNAASGLDGADVDITIVDRENHHLFQPLLYQVATSGLSPGAIAVPIRSVVGRQPNTRVVLGEALGVDLTRKEVTLSSGATLRYDWLVVAAGAKTNFFGNEHWAQHTIGLKNLRDAIQIRERVLLAFEAAEQETDDATRKRLLTFVVIGGGPTGVEMAGAISELGRTVLADEYQRIHSSDIRVILVEMATRLLTPFRPDLSASAADQLRELGVELRLGQRVTDVTAAGAVVNGELIPASLVVWASGVQPVSLAQRLGVQLTRRGQVRVDGNCAVLGHPDVFCIGDMAAFIPAGATDALPGLAPVAIQQGRYVARTIRGDLRSMARKPFVYVDKGIMATIGRSRAVVQSGVLTTSGLLAWLAWGFVHIVYLIGFRNRVMVLFEWMWAYVTYKRGTRLVTHLPRGADALPSPHALAPAPGTTGPTSSSPR
ncbi:MAG: NAD(P)/FAD-dependent oxidoreductase, partial [Myxococcales bacterium]|nr:NAD(P)/FAD-dependent oxidoreductase [Myxococcales bacterium]